MNNTLRFLLAGVSSLAIATPSMAQEVIQLEEIVLSLVDEGRENIEATGGTVIDAEDLRALHPQDVSDLFARESTVTVAGGGGPAKRIHVLGMEQSNLAVSVDGVPEVDTSWHHTGSAVIDPAFLKAVEVESGAASADAGFGAAAGAVRYETVSAHDMLKAGQNVGGRASLSYGTNGQGASASLASYGAANGFDWLVMLHKQDGDDYEDGDGDTILGTAPATAGVLAKLGYEFETHRLELAYQRDQDHADRTIKMNLGLADDTTLYPMDVTTDRLSLTYTSTAPTAAWDPKVQFYVSKFDYDRPDYVEDGANGDMRLEEEQFGGKAENRFELGGGTITAGVDFNQHDYHVDSYGDNPTRNFQTTQLGSYVQGRFEFGNGFDLSTGARADYMRYTDWNNERFSDAGMSANATLSYEFRPGFEVFAGASRTFMGYDLAEYGYLHARADGFVTDPDFEASSARNVKVGFNADTGPWQFGVTYFDTHIDDMPEYGWTDLVLSNAYDRRSEGYTLNGSYSWGAGRVGMTFTDVKTTENGEETLPSSGSFVPVGKTATLFVDQEFEQYDLKVGGSIAWAGSLDGDDWGSFYEMDSYTVVDAYAEWQPERLRGATLRVGVENLFDETYFERSSYATSSARGGIDPIYAEGRTFTISTSVDF
ncbi:TonB-dependent receptor [Paracoccus sp. 1_MG-2023]|uniref:TonB-dependent receptor domain-containing protein n=1 Tax=unclassified Paracoccus (in: a-proteobacteria) TaxID=2688777 RepID=UPI001C08BDC5|nr:MULTISPECIES: TonB-dependent receptor [unclassified Paracoccus (in: a-proteobacteria)]MBU2957872.1 TonB-dependent receptor [Paracoccus sp. C2R09]MDO6668936.1 TonB-dependent receptor [Paracoccus sp. 1_MG-2023]